MQTQDKPKVTNLTLRDGQQSTLDSADWIFHPRDFAKVITDSIKAGFSSAEIAGGQSFQIAISLGYNPFIILGAVSHALKEEDFDLQMLFRGANALGFRHYDKDLLEVTLQEFIRSGITKIRCFDALNDIENLELPDSIRQAENVILEGAICFTHYPDSPDRYTDAYFCKYAQALIKAGYTAIAIKDMSGQLTDTRVETLVPALLNILRPSGIPLTLHCHSTNEATSKAAVAKAVECGIDGIETSEGVLSGGSSHQKLEVVAPSLITDRDAYDNLQKRTQSLWGHSPERRDHQIAPELKERLCSAGVPGGAMPFVIRDLEQQQSTIRAKHQAANNTKPLENDDFATIIDLFIHELKRVCQDAAMPLLVTPTADICCKQAIANLALGANPHSDTLAERYLNNSGQPNPDTRFAKLILGYYGELKAYDQENSVHQVEPEIIQFFENNNSMQLKQTRVHPSQSAGGSDLREAQKSAWQLIQKLGARALSFASFDQLTVLYALKPAGMKYQEDPISLSLEKYLKRAEAARIDGRGRTFPEYEMLMQPILAYLGAMFVVDDQLKARDIPQIKIEKLGENFSKHLFDIYIDLPIWSRTTELRNHLSKLLSSTHVSNELLTAVENVSASLEALDARPARQEKSQFNNALKNFSQLTIGNLFNSLALVNSFSNHIAKYATNPETFSERGLTMEDLTKLTKLPPKDVESSAWENRIRQNLIGKNLRLEADFQQRVAKWRT